MSEGRIKTAQRSATISAVVFDVGRVIVEWDLRHLFAKLIDDRQELDWLLANVITQEWHFEHDAGRPLDDMLRERKALFPEHCAMIDAYRARFLETIPGPVPGTARLITRLHSANIPLFAITNFGDEFWAQFHPTRPELQYFRDIVVSGTEKIAKPDPAIFHLAQQRFGVDAPNMLFIDDNTANIASAAQLGWHTHLFTDAAGLEHDLIARGLIE